MVKQLRQIVEENAIAKRYLAYLWYRREAVARVLGSGRRLGSGGLVFTTEKCASIFLKKAIAIAGQYYGLRSYDYEGFYWNISNNGTEIGLSMHATQLFNHKKALYGPLRAFIPIPNLPARPIVLFLRDPRDQVVSAYYSRVYSHSLPGGARARAAFLKKRQEAQAMTVDEFAVFGLEEYLPKYRAYAEHLLPLSNVTCLSYESMISNLGDWLDHFLRGLRLPPRAAVIDRLRNSFAEGSAANSEFEDVLRHRRQQEPGDYLRKLSAPTIDRLNREVAPIVERFGLWKL